MRGRDWEKAFVEEDYSISPLAHYDIKLTFPRLHLMRLLQLHPDLFAAEVA